MSAPADPLDPLASPSADALPRADDHFALFQLPRRFAVAPQALDDAYRAVQRRIHPDRFASAGEAQKRIAMQWAARANEAYRVLKDPLLRVVYLLQLHDIDVRAETSVTLPPAFLMNQMEWRERIEAAVEAHDGAVLEALHEELAAARRERLATLEQLLDADSIAAAAAGARELLFIERLADEVKTQLGILEDG